jgi:hypothetical protein
LTGSGAVGTNSTADDQREGTLGDTGSLMEGCSCRTSHAGTYGAIAGGALGGAGIAVPGSIVSYSYAGRACARAGHIVEEAAGKAGETCCERGASEAGRNTGGTLRW